MARKRGVLNPSNTNCKDNGTSQLSMTAQPFKIAFTKHEASTDTPQKDVWRFGLYSQNSRLIEEHAVALVWSIDGTQVTVTCSKYVQPTDTDRDWTLRNDHRSEFRWKSQLDHHFRIVAYRHRSVLFQQYELYIDGISYFDLPPDQRVRSVSTDSSRSRSSLGATGRKGRSGTPKVRQRCYSESNQSDRLYEATPIKAGIDMDVEGRVFCNKFEPCEISDNLSSKVFHKVDADYGYEEGRKTTMRPAIDVENDACSNAIMMAFSDSNSIPKHRCSFDELTIEANALSDAYNFVQFWDEKAHNLRPLFLKSQLEFMVATVRRGILQPQAASRIFHNVQESLGLPIDKDNSASNTVVVFGLGRMAHQSDLWKTMLQYGPIDDVAIAEGGRGIGLCRFKASSSADQCVMESKKENGQLRDRAMFAMYLGSFFCLELPDWAHNGNTPCEENEEEHFEEKMPISEYNIDEFQRSPSIGYASSTTGPPPPPPPPKCPNSPLQRPITFLKSVFRTPGSPVSTRSDNGPDEELIYSHNSEFNADCPVFPKFDNDIGQSNITTGSQGTITRSTSSTEADGQSETKGEAFERKSQKQKRTSAFEFYRDNKLERFRSLVQCTIKDCEDMLSQALTTALFEPIIRDFDDWCDFDICEEAAMMDEVKNRVTSQYIPSSHSRTLLMQEELNRLAVLVRKREMSPEIASRSAYWCAELLHIDRFNDAPILAIAFPELSNETTSADLCDIIGKVGTIQAAAVTSKGGFGLVLLKKSVTRSDIVNESWNYNCYQR
mmetsp:Transcript_16100/g.29283  ORF Transcript_16100/g.29283 Transcript_16100/m.29283 type:complete len:778 (-) Transcript_16100:405-2738(-)